MKSYKAVCLYGILLWLIPFIVAFMIFPLKESNRPLFESIMAVAVTFSAVIFGMLYLSETQADFLKIAGVLGGLWFLMSIGLDLLLFMWGPMKMGFSEYMMDIGVTYLIIPVVTVGMGWVLEKTPRRVAPADRL